jgi:FMN phosphatase YigB (HAD superfamily)
MKFKAVIFDLDGTLCDATHRRKYVQHAPKNWYAFNAACVNDTPNKHVKILHDMIVASREFVILYSSGRSAEFYDETVQWLEENLSHDHQISIHNRLFMRSEGDRRPDNIVKKEMLDKFVKHFDIEFAVDDRDIVVSMWRENGIPCFQCAPGDF